MVMYQVHLLIMITSGRLKVMVIMTITGAIYHFKDYLMIGYGLEALLKTIPSLAFN